LTFGTTPSNDSIKNFEDYVNEIENQTQNLDFGKSFKSLMSALWYSRLPCYDVKDMTAQNDGEKSILKICIWKGELIPCSAIFKTMATDRGMCCVFNHKEAEKIFKDSEYSRLVNEQNNRYKNNSFQNATIPDFYTKQGTNFNNYFMTVIES